MHNESRSGEMRPTPEVYELLELISDAFLVVDGEEHCRFANREAQRATGLSRCAIVVRSLREMFSRPQDDVMVTLVRRSMRDRVSTRFLWTSQNARTFEVFAKPMKEGAAVLLRELKARQQRSGQQPDDALAASERRHRALFDQCPAGIVVYDSALRITDCNEGMARLLGVPCERVVGMRLEDLRDQRHREGLRRALAGETVKYESPYQATLVEKWLWVSATFAPMHDAAGVITGVIVLIVDRTREVEVGATEPSTDVGWSAAQRLAQVGSWAWDIERNVAAASSEFRRILHSPTSGATESPESFERLIHADDRADCRAQLEEVFARRIPFAMREFRVMRDNRSIAHVILRAQITYTDRGRPLAAWGTLQDVSERRLLEEQLRTAQRMESLGRLAGGVAHDFNNLLTVIRVQSEFLGEGLPAGDALHADLHEVRRAADRAAALTRRLLAFSRKQLLRPRLVDLNELVADTTQMLRRLIGEDIELATKLDPDLPPVLADPAQLEQVLMNLAVNARDAMPDGGVLLVHTASASIDDGNAVLPPGNYVVLIVSDTGRGMDADTRQHAFEPFFTTKPPCFGTELGLSIVRGIIEQSGGHISLASDPGRGTRFTVHLPRASDDGQPEEDMPQHQAREGTPQSATLFVVEDDPALRLACRRILERDGYKVLTAEDGYDALATADSFSGTIDLLITDMVLPGLNGRDVAGRLGGSRPAMRVLYMSGYTDDDTFARGLRDQNIDVLEKPFTGEDLRSAVRRALHGNDVAD